MQRYRDMKAFTAIALVVLATASTGSAQPREERGGRVELREVQPPSHADGWLRLATPTPSRYGTEWVVVARTAGPLRALRIEATTGSVHLRRVVVEFQDGASATFNVDQWLDRHHPNARIDFGAPRRLASLAITTAKVPAGTYTVYGSRSPVPTSDLVARR
jgi:hypothetical protein